MFFVLLYGARAPDPVICGSAFALPNSNEQRVPFMCTDRRDFLRASAGVAGAMLLGGHLNPLHAEPAFEPQGSVPEPISRLQRMTDGIAPITLDERRQRIEKAQRLMKEQRIDAIYVEPG